MRIQWAAARRTERTCPKIYQFLSDVRAPGRDRNYEDGLFMRVLFSSFFAGARYVEGHNREVKNLGGIVLVAECVAE